MTHLLNVKRSLLVSSFVLSALIGFCPAEAFAARGTEGGGGGDEIGLEFKSLAERVFADIDQNHPSIKVLMSGADVGRLVRDSAVLVVDTPLVVKTADGLQEGVAYNIPQTATILVNRSRWNSISDRLKKSGIILHEILSLAGMEQTGFYPISGKYVAAFGQTPEFLKLGEVDSTTYLSCLDSSSSMILVKALKPEVEGTSLGSTIRIEIQALSEKDLSAIQAVAKAAGVLKPEEVRSVKFEIAERNYGTGKWGGRPDQYCRFNVFNKTMFECSDRMLGSGTIRRKIAFSRFNGDLVAVDAGIVDFRMEPSSDVPSSLVDVRLSLENLPLYPNYELGMAIPFETSVKPGSCGN